MTNNKIQIPTVELPSDELLEKCIHCGMCLPTCPTYNITFDEKSSPRGRIRLIKSVLEGKLEITETFVREINFCLDCQACETACPAGVKYGQLLEATRVVIEDSKYNSKLKRFIKKFAFRKLIPYSNRLKFAARLLRLYEKSGLQNLFRKIKLLKIFSKKLFEIEALSPKISDFFFDDKFSGTISPKGKVKHRIAFLSGCLMNVMFAEINQDTIEVLLENNCEIIIPEGQTCCGSMQAHNGDFEIAHSLAKKNIDIFSKYDFDFIVINSAGCGAFMKEYKHIFKDDPEYSEKAKNISNKVLDIMEYLNRFADFSNLPEYKKKVTYHEACHLVHTQKISDEPRNVIASIKGLEIIPLNEATWCCGSAGIYNIVNYEDSMIILDRKMKNIIETGAEIILTGNPGCIGQLRYGCKKYGLNSEVLHPITLINRVYKLKK